MALKSSRMQYILSLGNDSLRKNEVKNGGYSLEIEILEMGWMGK